MPGESLNRNIERGPTGRVTLTHLFGVPQRADRHEEVLRRTPPFTRSGVAKGCALMAQVGVVLEVVTSTSLHSTNNASCTLHFSEPSHHAANAN
jgi:hypothetical protein